MSIAFTPGEPAGIGPDLAIIYAQQKTDKNLLVFTDPDLLIKRAKKINLNIKIKESDSISNQGEICVFPIKLKNDVKAGTLNVENAAFVLETLNTATQFCLSSKCEALLTGPVHKGIINQSGVEFTGHTEYLAKISSTDQTVMMLSTKGLSVALATTHLSLAQVPSHIQTETLTKTIEIIHHFLLSQGIKKPSISVCGLNPHAGEDGHLGREEIEIINPIINQLNQKGYRLTGSVPADTAFTPDALNNVDVVLCMYHDQGLPVLKTLGFKKAVNVTLGLPFIRTSVDHGTALELAGTGNISLGSFNTALEYTQTLINHAKS